MADIVKLKKKAADFEAKKDVAKALVAYREIIQAYEDGEEDQIDIPLYNRVGELLQKAGNAPEAIQIWERAVDHYIEGGFHNPAIALCNRILRASPGRTSIYYKLGKISAQKGFKADARQNFLEYASRQQKAGNMDDAFKALKEFMELVPDQHDMRLMLADQLMKVGKKDEAIGQLQLGYATAVAASDDANAATLVAKMKAIDPSVEPNADAAGDANRGGGDLIFLDVDTPKRRATAASKAVAGIPMLDPGPAKPAAPPAPKPAPTPPPAPAPPPVPVAAAPAPVAAAPAEPAAPPAPPAPAPAPEPPAPRTSAPVAEPAAPKRTIGPPPRPAAKPPEAPAAAAPPPPAAPRSPTPTPIVEPPTIEVPAPPDEPFTPEPVTEVEEISLEIETTNVAAAPAASGALDGLELTNLAAAAPADAAPADAAPEVVAEAVAEIVAEVAEVAQAEAPVDDLPILEPEPPPPVFEAEPNFGSALVEVPEEVSLLGDPPPEVIEQDVSLLDDPLMADMTVLDVEESTELASSVDMLRQQVETMPEDWSLRRQFAEALLEDGQREEAITELETSMLGFEQEGDVATAASVAEEIVRLEPSSIRYQRKRVEFAVRVGDRAKLADAYIELADALLAEGQGPQARAVYQRVLDIRPDDLRAQAAIEAIPVEHDEAAPARRSTKITRTPVKETPSAPTPSSVGSKPMPAASDDDFVDLGALLGDDDEPKSTRMVVAEQEPTGDEQADFADMLAKFKQGISQNVEDEDFEAHYDLGVAYKEMGLLDEAIAEFQKALRGQNNRVRAIESLGHCFVEKGQLPVANTILQRALSEGMGDDSLVGVLYLLGVVNEDLGNFAEAKQYFERVFSVDIQFRDVGDRLNAIQAKLK